MVKLATAKRQENDATAKIQTVKPQFDKKQVITSVRYANQRDLVEALLDDGKKYTFETVDNLIEKYKKGQVK